MQFAYRIHRCGLWVLLLALSSHSHAAGYYGGGGYVDADIGLRYESNLSRANEGKDIEEDMVTALSAGAGYLKILDDSSQLLISAYLAHERFAEFKDLNNVAINTAMVYTIQPHRAYTDPWYKFSADVSRRQFTESNIRDSYIVSAVAGAGKRVTDRIIAEIGYRFEHRMSDAEVFDTDNHELEALLVYSYSSGVSLFGNYTLQIGEAVSTATPNPTILAASESVAPDDEFAPGLGPGCVNRRCAYRLDAIGHYLEAGVEVSLNQKLTLDLSGRYFIVDGDGLGAYKGWIYRAGLYIQF